MKRTSLALSAFFALTGAVHANLLTNGGFEDGLAGWANGAVYSGYGIVSNLGAWDGTNALAVSGGGRAGIGEGMWLEQSVALPAGEYDLSLAGYVRALGTDSPFGESATNARCIYRLDMYVDGVLRAWADYLDDTSPYDYDNDTGWLPLATTWTGPVNSNVSVLARLNGGDWVMNPMSSPYVVYRHAMIDGLSLEATAIPEPATLLLLTLALVRVKRAAGFIPKLPLS